MNYIKNRLIVIIILVFPCFCTNTFAQSGHPFLITNETEYDYIRQRKNDDPWKLILTRAHSTFNNAQPIDLLSESIKSAAFKMRDLMDSAALLYVVDSLNKTTYLERIRDYLFDWKSLKESSDYGKDWNGSVPVGSAFFVSVIAYDVIYNALSENDKTTIESYLSEVANDFYDGYETMDYWPLNRWGAAGIWYMFKNDSLRSYCIENYRENLFEMVNVDGIFQNSITYARDRLSTYNRVAKTHFMDVLEFTNEDNSYYSSPRLQKFYYWLYGLSVTPNGGSPTFGDTNTGNSFSTGPAPGIYRAHKFSNEVAQVATWLINRHNYSVVGGLINYVLHDQSLPSAKYPTSMIYSDGGAFFIEKDANDNSFYAALWNPKADVSHGHKDINAIHLSAYGENLLQNSGYNYWGNGFEEFSWTDIHDRAWTNNVVQINNKDHKEKKGYGIIEGLTAESFDYASGNAGLALDNGTHIRNLIMVHPQNDENGYFAIFDEVTTENISDSINVLFHPNGDSVVTTTLKQEYEWKIQPFAKSLNNAGVIIFLGTVPQSVNIGRGPLCDASKSFIGEFINSTYKTDENGKGNIVTLIIPFDKSHSKPNINRVSGTNFSGVEIIYDNQNGYILSSDNESIVYLDNLSFQGLATVFHKGSDINDFYFVRKGKIFDYGLSSRNGFESDSDISIYIKGKKGKIISPKANVIFYSEGINGVKINGNLINNKTIGPNWVEVEIPEGSHDLELLTSQYVSVTNKERLETFTLSQNCPNPFNPTTTIHYSIPAESEVTISIYDMLGRKVKQLISSKQPSGDHSFKWNGRDNLGKHVGAGIYFYQIQAGDFVQTKKMVLMK